MSKIVGIIGCGWLGLALAEVLLAENYQIHGSTTTPDKLEGLKKLGIVPFRIVLHEDSVEGTLDDFLDTVEILIINVPPKLRGSIKENYVSKMRLLHTALLSSKVEKVVFISSTSVYGNIQGVVTEDSPAFPVTESGKQLLAAENIFRKDPRLQTAILRFGGLIGPKRHPITNLAGKENLQNGNEFVNLIHLEDCTAMIYFVLKNNLWNETYNGVYPSHPKKMDYYRLQAEKKDLPAPKYVTSKSKYKGKQIKSRNFLNKNYCFSTPITD